MNTIRYIGIHNTGGIGSDQDYSTINFSLETINQGHKARWPGFSSSYTGSHVGYNLVVFPSGQFVQTRWLGEETAAQVGHNFDTLSICVVGNYHKKENGLPVDVMTPEAKKTLKDILVAAIENRLEGMGIKIVPGTILEFAINRILPHRLLQLNHTECFGSSLPDNFGSSLVLDHYYSKLNLLKLLLAAYISLNKLQARPSFNAGFVDMKGHVCEGFININNN